MPQTRFRIVAIVVGDTPSVFGRLDLREQRGMVDFFDTEDIVQIVGLEGLNVRSIGTQAVFRDDKLEVRVVLTELDNDTLGCSAFTISFGLALYIVTLSCV